MGRGVAICDEDCRTWGELGICWGYLDCSGGVLMCGWRDSCDGSRRWDGGLEGVRRRSMV